MNIAVNATEILDPPKTAEQATRKPAPNGLHDLTDDPRYIGASSERPSARKLVRGQGCYVDDIELPRMAHVVYWRSPVAHCRITRCRA